MPSYISISYSVRMSQGYYQEIRLIKIAARAGRLLAKPSYPSLHLKPAIPSRSRYSISTGQLCVIAMTEKAAYIGIDALKRDGLCSFGTYGVKGGSINT